MLARVGRFLGLDAAVLYWRRRPLYGGALSSPPQVSRMNVNPILRRVADQVHLFNTVPLDRSSGCSGLGWRFRDGEGVGQVDFLQISRALLVDISDFRCFHEKHMSLASGGAPVLKLRFKLSGCSLLHFNNGDEPMLGEHCSVGVYSPRDLQHETLTRDLAERSVTLHCGAGFFLRDLGLEPEATPQPIRAFLEQRDMPRAFRRTRLTAHMRRTVMELMQPPCLPQFARPYREVKARELALSLLIALAESETPARTVGNDSSKRRGLEPVQLQRMTDCLQENLGEEADLGALARLVGGEPLRLARAFKHSTGMSVQQYRLRARIERARELLVEGRLPLKAVGQDAGFYDQAHFTRAFRVAFGTTPLRYRREFGKSGG
jgi:AraC-like DNA-binding protein